MKIDYLVFGIIVILFAALLVADAVIATNTPANMILSPNDVKGITGAVFGIIAVFFFIKAFMRARE
jgi:membrane associated rhomboid family serine protease